MSPALAGRFFTTEPHACNIFEKSSFQNDWYYLKHYSALPALEL